MNPKERCKGIIKCYLILNKGKWFTSKQIADFLLENSFYLGTYANNITPMRVSHLINHRYGGIFSDIEVEKKRNGKRYRYNGND